MKVFFTDQRNQFPKHLLELKNSNIISYQKDLLKNKISKQSIACNFSELTFDSFFDYKIFPSNILTSFPQWKDENRTIQSGDTIVQQINIPPFDMLSQRLIVGVRVKEVFNDNHCKGFSYETLKGHVEKGISIFRIEPKKDFSVFTVETYSSPAIPILKTLHPFSSLYQDYCTKQALLNVKRMLNG